MKDKPTTMDDDAGGTGLGPDWAELTHECLAHILSFLSAEDRWARSMLVCKSWLRATRDSFRQSSFDLEAHFDPTTEYSRWWSPEFEGKVNDMVRSVVDWTDGSLTELRVRHCSDGSLSLVAQRCPNLGVLSIRNCPNVTDESMSKIAFGCPNLHELSISGCYRVSHVSLAVVATHCPAITHLKLNLLNWLDPAQYLGIVPRDYLTSCPQEGDSVAEVIGKLMPRLTHLELRFSKITARGLGYISGGCRDLEFLDLSGCVNLRSQEIASATSGMENLKRVKKFTYHIPRSVFHRSPATSPKIWQHPKV